MSIATSLWLTALLNGGDQGEPAGDGLVLLLAGATIVLALAWMVAHKG